MESLYSTIHYWLVDHPAISQFEWKQGQTFGSSLFFITTSVSIYLSLTLLAACFSTHLPSLSTTTLRRITALHSLILCLLSVVMVVGCSLSFLKETPSDDLKWFFCLPTNTTRTTGPVFFWVYVCYLSKFVEFIDTLLIALSSSRSRRLSFLHVYHHTMVTVLGRIGLSVSQSMLGFACIINSSVHVLMYAYYFLSAIGRKPWWKRMVTNYQIFQFGLGFLFSAVMLYYHFTTEFGCTGVGAWCFGIVFNASLLVLFLDFHSKNYVKNTKKEGEDQLDKDK